MSPKSNRKTKGNKGSRKDTTKRQNENRRRSASGVKKEDQGERAQKEGKRDSRSDFKGNKSPEVVRSGLNDSRKDNTTFSRQDSMQPSSDMRMEHRRSSSRDRSSQSQSHICRDFIHSQCTKGADCLLYHPPVSVGGGQEQQVPWFAICHNHLLGICDHLDCSFFHISKEDEEMYRRRGEISPQVVDRAVHKTLVGNHDLIGFRLYCKAFLHGVCLMPNCQLRHLSQWEYTDIIFYELLDEFQYLFGMPESGSFPSLDSNPLMPGNPGDMMAVNDESGHNNPPLDLEPERKRIRYSPGDPGFSEEGKRWDDPVHSERNQIEPSRERNLGTSRFMEEIIILRNDNMEMTRKAEMKIEKLREELSKLAQANSKLCTDSNERSDKYNAEVQLLMSAKTTLLEEKRGLQRTVQELEHKVSELHKTVDETEEKKRALVQMMVQRNVELTKNLTKEAEKSQETVRELENKTTKLQEALTLERHKAQQPLKELERKNAELQKSLKMERQKSEEVLKELESKNKKMHDTVDQKVREAVKRYEEENRQLRKSLDGKPRAGTEAKKKLEVAEKKLADSRESFSRLNDLLREKEHRSSQLEVENEELKKKMHMMHDEFTAWKKMQEITSKPGYRPRNAEGYSRNEDYQGGWHKGDDGRLGQQSWNRSSAREDNIRPMDLLRQTLRKRETADSGGVQYSTLGYSRRGESTHGKSPPHKELSDTIDLNIRRPDSSRDYDSSTSISKKLMDYFQMSSGESSQSNPINISPQGHQEIPRALGHAASFQAPLPPPPVIRKVNNLYP